MTSNELEMDGGFLRFVFYQREGQLRTESQLNV
jgi:hypothetical protein